MVAHADITEMGIDKGNKISTEKGGKLIVLGCRFRFDYVELKLMVHAVDFWETGSNEGERSVDADVVCAWLKSGRLRNGW